MDQRLRAKRKKRNSATLEKRFMAAQLPEATLDEAKITAILSRISKSSSDFSISKITFWDHQGEVSETENLETFFSIIKSIPPSKRDGIQIKFLIQNPRKIGKKLTGIIHLGHDQDRSKFELTGSKGAVLDEQHRILPYFLQHKRTLSNQLGKAISIVLFTTLLAAVGAFWPSSIFSDTKHVSVAAGLIGIPSITYFFLRPHIFLEVTKFDFLLLFTNKRQLKTLLSVAILFAAAALSLQKIPILLKYDSRLVAQSRKIQNDVIRRYVTPEMLTAVQQLELDVKRYDNATSEEERIGHLTLMLLRINRLTTEENAFTAPILKQVPILVSSARSIESGNFLQDAAILGYEMRGGHEGQSMVYRPRINMGFSEQKRMQVDSWLKEVILKDKYGSTWTRESLLKQMTDKYLLSKASAPMELKRLENHPDKSVQFSHNNKTINVQNSAEAESVRAIAEELIRTHNLLQKELSAGD